MRWSLLISAMLMLGAGGLRSTDAQSGYELLLKGGHVIDPRNGIDSVMDVAITGGTVARWRATSRQPTPSFSDDLLPREGLCAHTASDATL